MSTRLLLVALLLVGTAACGQEAPKVTSGGGACTPSGSGTTDLAKKPVVTIPDSAPPTETKVEDIVCGKGELLKTGQIAEIKYVGLIYKGGTEFGSTWKDDKTTPVRLGSGTIKGFSTGLTGMRVGGRRMVTIPPKDGFGAEGRPPAIPPDSTLVFVIDLVRIKPPTPCTPSGKGSTDLTKKPTVERLTGPAPKTTTVVDIVCGKGQEADEGSNVAVQYVGVLYQDGKEFDSSWTSGKPFEFTVGQGVVPGFSKALIGMRVGGRRQVVITPEDGYGAAGQPPAIPPNSTLVFVIDLVKLS